MTLSQVLQSLIFASPKPVSGEELHKILKGAGESSEHPDAQALSGISMEELEEALAQTRDSMEQTGLPFRMVEGATGWSMVTHADYAPWVRQLYPEAKPTRLSGPALETLAIIAYRQPLTRADIEAVRGVAVDGVMQVLLDRGLVKISGRADLPGRPLLYSTTTYFLEHFGLKSTEELPNSDELRRLELPKAEAGEEKEKGEKAERVGKKRSRKMEGLEETSVAGTGSAELMDSDPSRSPLAESSGEAPAESNSESSEGSAVQSVAELTDPQSEVSESTGEALKMGESLQEDQGTPGEGNAGNRIGTKSHESV